ncbi:MAG: HPF/RaiA family ribosome-associated protein [Gammaproteobacteria bacterium]|nr:HPF/RaiA family ribosome-associated protein [Gammaproteobacteria bacterium]
MSLQIEIEGMELTDALDAFLHKSLATVERRWGDRITHVRMYVKDENSPEKSGVDKHVTLEARVAGLDPIATHALAPEAYDAITGAADKLERAMTHAIERRERR